MLTEIKYRTFDELLDSVKIDYRNYDLESMINTQELIKVAQKVNADLGIVVSMSKTKVLEVSNGKTRLPSDFHVLNFAFLCDDEITYDYALIPQFYKPYNEAFREGVLEAESYFEANMVKQFTIKMTVEPGENMITHGLNTKNIILQAFGADNSLLSFDVQIVSADQVRIISELLVPIEHVKVVIMGARSSYSLTCPADSPCPPEPSLTPIPVEQLPCCTAYGDNNGCPTILASENGRTREFHRIIPLSITKAKSVSADPVSFESARVYNIYIKNNFIVTNFLEGTIYINYQSTMEDEEGNLLVMDHPLVNEYYEYALKQRILENLMMYDENVINKLGYVEGKLKMARNNAHTYVRMPGFYEMYNIWKLNRKAMYSQYYDMFKSKRPVAW